MLQAFLTARRLYARLTNIDDSSHRLLKQFEELINELVKLFDDVPAEERLLSDIVAFFHDIDLSLFGGYELVYTSTAQEHYTIERISAAVEVFCWLHPLGGKPQQETSRPTRKEERLSPLDSSEKAQNIIAAVEVLGLCSVMPGGKYKWLHTKTLLRYFIKRANIELNLTRGELVNWAIWESVFNIDTSDFAKREASDRAKGVFFPRDRHLVDNAYKWETKYHIPL